MLCINIEGKIFSVRMCSELEDVQSNCFQVIAVSLIYLV